MNPPRFISPRISACRQGRGFAASVERDRAAVCRAVHISIRNPAWLLQAR